MEALKYILIFAFIFLLILNFYGKVLAEEEFIPELKITVDRWGNITIQSVPDESSRIFQSGIYNYSFHISYDITNFSSILQLGQFNYSHVKQSGTSNEAKVQQQGNNNTAVIKQSTEDEDKGEEEQL